MRGVNDFFDLLGPGRLRDASRVAILDSGLHMDHPLLREYRVRVQLGPEMSRDFMVRMPLGSKCEALVGKDMSHWSSRNLTIRTL
jgi:hypothetical protein